MKMSDNKHIYALSFILVITLTLLLPSLSALAGTPSDDSAKISLTDAIHFMDEGDYQEAVSLLESIDGGLPLINDHVLALLAAAYAKTDDHIKASNTAGAIVKKYPRSSAARKAHKIKALSDSITHPERAISAFKSFLRKYKNDDEIKLELAIAYIMESEHSRADKVLAELYAKAGPYAEEAYDLMNSKKLSKRVLLKRADSLMDKLDFAGAEAILRQQLSPEGWNRSIKRQLARTLFRQRKYKEAAPVYHKLGDLYMASRSHLRAGNKVKFYEMVEQMYKAHDRKIPRLIIAHAADLRKDNRHDKAEAMLERLSEKYPEARTKIQWALGWHYYQRGLNHTAHQYFERLTDKHSDQKYRYWMARAGEKIGFDMTDIYAGITGKGYYPLMARMRLGIQPDMIDHTQSEPDCSLDTRRADLLIEVGLTKEAAEELSAMSRKRRIKDNDLIALAYRMQSIGMYRQAILLGLRVPENKRPIDLLYPQAYWETVMDVSQKYTMDPLLVLSLIREESKFDSTARSKVGAMGLMQLMPETAKRTARKARLALEDTVEDVLNVDNNIHLGSFYLNSLLMEFKSVPASLAAYNAGENRVRKWLRQSIYEGHDEFIEDIPFTETRNYVKRILNSHFMYNSYLSHRQYQASTKGL